MAVRVLLIDDDEGEYVITRDILSFVQREKFEIEWLSSYEAGLRAACSGRHDACLVDYFLSSARRNGVDLIRAASSSPAPPDAARRSG